MHDVKMVKSQYRQAVQPFPAIDDKESTLYTRFAFVQAECGVILRHQLKTKP